ncbi:antibiotic biosynthesis monooxygenase family protein [Streptomyces caatingaensis]|uniref:ABM domain-containing protein n=1 Tax=Streptomyces caatingaensis TaxID=1678637 RepID=A0A0K9XHA6_9ACTN|nr:antibiotic biosynthesis monooxygenase [Streptomyces caatingaensis]KNB52638.1 hypothetical protein AC230_08230 [Streptomyces caatingaensis]
MSDIAPATLPEPPYYVVVFSALITKGCEDYDERAAHMLELAFEQPGFLGIDSALSGSGLGITVSYWRDDASIRAWRDQAEHAVTRAEGRERWYEKFVVHVARVERSYSYTRPARS